jgi:hypothetical protein
MSSGRSRRSTARAPRRSGPLNYRQAREGVVAFSGTLAASRSFPGEFIHQHLDAYLEELRLAPALNALKFFI